MTDEKIAILIDYGTDVPKNLIEKYHMFVVPLMVVYSDGEYRSDTEITSQEIFDRLPTEVPRTSLPPMNLIHEAFENIKAEGYEKVIGVTISSGLSGTFNAVSLVSQEFPEITTTMVDTKNIGIGAGLTAILAGELVSAGGLTYEEILAKLEKSVTNTKVFFCVETLEYLRKGGRIGLVAGMLGSALGLKPVITCNKDGIYDTVSKARGRKQSLKKALACADEFRQGAKKFRVVIANGGAEAEAAVVLREAKLLMQDACEYMESLISAALVVHTGPGLLGVGVQILD